MINMPSSFLMDGPKVCARLCRRVCGPLVEGLPVEDPCKPVIFLKLLPAQVFANYPQSFVRGSTLNAVQKSRAVFLMRKAAKAVATAKRFRT